MPLYPLDSFSPNVPRDPPIPNNQDIPKDELDIFFRSEASFLPAGKTFSDLTEQERKNLRNKYKYCPLRPSMYQGITGLGPMM